jgi:hypothetical protein
VDDSILPEPDCARQGRFVRYIVPENLQVPAVIRRTIGKAEIKFRKSILPSERIVKIVRGIGAAVINIGARNDFGAVAKLCLRA